MVNETSTELSVAIDRPMKDVTTDIEAILYGSDEEVTPDADTEDVSDDADLPVEDEQLPEDDDAEEEESGGEDLDEVADDGYSLAAYLGVDDERIVETEDGSLMFNAIIDGETKQVPLKDLASNFQLQSHVNNKSIALENERKEFESNRNTVAQELKQRVEGVQALNKLAEDELVSQYNNVDWDKLRVEDPANWTALRQEYAEKAQNIQQAQGLAQQEAERLQGEQQQQFQENMQNHMKEEYAKMIGKNPDWADETKFESDMAGLKSFVASAYGYTEQDFQGVNDHRLIELIKDAKAFREGTKGAEEKKVKRVPKFTKPGGARKNAAQLSKARAIKARKQAMVQSGGSTQATANLLIDRM